MGKCRACIFSIVYMSACEYTPFFKLLVLFSVLTKQGCIDAKSVTVPVNTGAIFDKSSYNNLSAELNKTGQIHPIVWIVCAIVAFLLCCYGIRLIWLRVRPPDAIIAQLELDDVPIERFDGIEDTLFRRLRDPFGYSPMNQVADNDEEQDGYEQQANKYLGRSVGLTDIDRFDIREAAMKLRDKAKSMVYSLVGAGSTVSSLGSTGMPTVNQQEEMQKLNEIKEAEALKAKDKERAVAVKGSSEEKELAKALQKELEPFRHAAGGPKGRGGGTQWDTWGDESAWEGNVQSKEEKDDNASTGSASGKRAEATSKGILEQKQYQPETYHAQKGGAGAIKTDTDDNPSNLQFGPRKVGAYSVADSDQWSSVRGRAPPAVSAAGGSFSQGSGPLARQNTMQAQGLVAPVALDKDFKRSPDKKVAMTVDLSQVSQAPPSIKAPPIKFNPSAIPPAPASIPTPVAPKQGINAQAAAMLQAPIAPRGVPLPRAPRVRPLVSQDPQLVLSNSPNAQQPSSTVTKGIQSPESPSKTLKIQAAAVDADDDGGYSLNMDTNYVGIANTTGTSVNTNALPGNTRNPSSMVMPLLPRPGPPPASSAGAAAAAAAASRMPVRGAPPQFTGPPPGSGSGPPRFPGGNIAMVPSAGQADAALMRRGPGTSPSFPGRGPGPPPAGADWKKDS